MAEDLNTVEDDDMAEYDGEKVVTMVDVLQEQEKFEQDANAVLGASDDKNCTYNKGYVKRQALYACMTCCPEAKDDPSKRAGICLACSLSCHESHDCIELYTKRNFRCDCGNSKFSHPCNFTQVKTDINENNSYNQNFSGLYCTCNRPYPDPENSVQDDMIQCIICEDWLHASHLEATVPGSDQYAEMICKECMEKNPFLHDYNDLAVNVDHDIDIINVTSEHCDAINEIISLTHNTTEDATKNINIEMSETVNEMNTEKSITTSESNENEVQAVIANKDIKDNEVDGNKALESDTTEKASMEECIEKSHENDTANLTVEKICDENDTANLTVEKMCDENERKQDLYSETSEKNNDSKDFDNNINEKSESDAKKIVEDQYLPDPSLEDNIKALSDLINETNVETIENNSNCPVNINSELLNETSYIGENTTETSDDKTTNILSSEIETGDTGKADFSIDPADASENKKENKNIDTDHTDMPNLIHDEQLDAKLPDDQSIVNENNDSTEGQPTEEKTEKELDNNDKSDECYIKAPENIETNGKMDLVNETNNHLESQDIKMISDHIDEGNQVEPKEAQPTMEVELIPNNFETPDDIVKTTPKNIVQTTPEDVVQTIPEERNDTPRENKRKMSSHAEVEVCGKKVKLNEEKRCTRPKGVKRVHKGATFWASNFRQKLCTCNECLSMYKDLSVLFLLDFEDTVSFYEYLAEEKIKNEGLPKSQYEKGLEALSSLDRVQQINALTEYNKLKDKLLNYFKSFKERKEVVKEADIKAFFAGIKPKREPDGVYFCR